MLKKILWLLLLIILAWFFQPVLEALLPFPTESMLSGLLNLENEGDRNILLLLRYIFWMALLYVGIKFTGPFLSFMMPWSRRYSVTKPLRRIQGVAYEIGLILLFFSLCLFLIIGPLGSISIFKGLSEKEKELFVERYNELNRERIKSRKELQEIAIKGNELLNSVSKRLNDPRSFQEAKTIYYSSYQLDFKIPRSLEYMRRYEPDLSARPSPFKFSLPKQKLKDSVLTIKNYSPTNLNPEPPSFNTPKGQTKGADYLASKLNSSSLSEIPKTEDISVSHLNIFERRSYDAYLNQFKAASEKYDHASDQVLELLGTTEKLPVRDYFASVNLKSDETNEIVKDRVWNEIRKKPSILIFPALSNNWLLAFLFGVAIYLPFRGSAKHKISGFLLKLSRIVEQGRFGLGGSSRFAGIIDEWANVYKKQEHELFLGRSLFNSKMAIGLEDKRHMLTVAATRAGKGASAVIPNLLLWQGSALVIDPKGTNAIVTSDRRKNGLEQNVYVVDPFGITGKETAKFNPLKGLDPNSPTVREQINLIAEALVVPDTEQKEKHWDDSARTVIAGLIAHLISSGKTSNPTLPMIRDMLNLPPKEQEELWIDMILNDKAGKLAKDAGSRVMRGLGTNEMSSILSNADKHTEWLSSSTIETCLSDSSFDFAELKEKQTTIYLVLPPNKLVTYNRFLRLFVNLALSEVSSGKRSKIPVLMIMDEFLSLGRMEEVEKAFGLLAGYNLTLWPIVQETGKLKDIYKDSFNSFINNSRAVQVFGVYGETAKFVSDTLGERTTKGLFRNDKKERIVKLRTPNEVTIDVSVDHHWQYILRAGKPPLVLEKAYYYKDPLFEGLYTTDPDYENENNLKTKETASAKE